MSQMTVSARLGAVALRPPFAADRLRTERRTRVQSAAPAAGHTGFMVMCLLIVMATFTAVLVLNTSRAEGSYVLSRLTVEQTALHDTKVTLQAELASLESSESLAASARKLKMVPSTSTATLRLSDGSLTGVASKVDGGRTLTVDLPATGVASPEE
jgi:hypothetical protein